MSDIFHQLVKRAPDFEDLSEEELSEASDLYAAGAFAINSALTLIGNLAHGSATSEEYADEDASRDLVLVSHVLRYFPRMARALNRNSDLADYFLQQRREGKV